MQFCPSSYPFQTQLGGLWFQHNFAQVTELLISPASCLPHTRHKLPAFIFKVLLIFSPPHISSSTQLSTLLPKFSKSSPKHQHQLLQYSQHCIFCLSAQGGCSLLVPTSSPYRSPSAEFLSTINRKYVLVLLKSLMWTGVDSLLLETHPSSSCWFTFSHPSCTALKYHLYR